MLEEEEEEKKEKEEEGTYGVRDKLRNVIFIFFSFGYFLLLVEASEGATITGCSG